MRKFIAPIATVLVLALVLTIVAVAMRERGKGDPDPTAETETEVETTEEDPAYLVDLLYVERMLKENRFTDEFEDYTKDSFPASTDASKEAYWHGIQQGTVVNPLLLAATSETLHALGFNTQDVKPSELYYTSENGEGVLNEKGEQVLDQVRKVIFSDLTRVYTADLGKDAGKYYNSSPSKENGIVYGQRVGISGNTACWIITTNEADAAVADVDSAYDNILRVNGGETTTASSSAQPKTVVQLCRCGNTATKNPPKPTPTTRKSTPTTTKQSTTTTTKKPTTTKPSTTKPTTTVPSTTKPSTTKPTTTKAPTTKNPEKDPVNQSNAPRGGGKNDPTEKATSSYQPEKPTKATTVRTVESTTKPTTTTTTRPSTTKAPTTRPATTNPTTTAPTMKPTEKPSSSYSNGTTTTVISRDDVFTGDPVLPD